MNGNYLKNLLAFNIVLLKPFLFFKKNLRFSLSSL